VCYSYPVIEFQALSLFKAGDKRFYVTQDAKDVAQALMRVSRSKAVPFFNKAAADLMYGFKDLKDPSRFYLTGTDRFHDYDIIPLQKDSESDLADVKTLENDLVTNAF
jgi:hypothetical protein